MGRDFPLLLAYNFDAGGNTTVIRKRVKVIAIIDMTHNSRVVRECAFTNGLARLLHHYCYPQVGFHRLSRNCRRHYDLFHLVARTLAMC